MKKLVLLLFGLLIATLSFCQLTPVNIGASANDRTGDPLRTAFGKLNDNDEYLEDLSNSGIVPVSSTGTSIAFDVVRTYGYTTAIIGNLTLNVAGFREGITQLIIHNDTGEPSMPSEMKVIGGVYVPDVDNYIFLHAVKDDLILVTISQEL